ncbi:MAG: hypothetical protein A2Y95_12275 [Deltaproteobacteria bacterium RBG_13_65_10]|nr:MAG: hypothetical protein A2Y95_12275 [Deltaproteobacteria bacterium RBG_13_65_10]
MSGRRAPLKSLPRERVPAEQDARESARFMDARGVGQIGCGSARTGAGAKTSAIARQRAGRILLLPRAAVAIAKHSPRTAAARWRTMGSVSWARGLRGKDGDARIFLPSDPIPDKDFDHQSERLPCPLQVRESFLGVGIGNTAA